MENRRILQALSQSPRLAELIMLLDHIQLQIHKIEESPLNGFVGYGICLYPGNVYRLYPAIPAKDEISIDGVQSRLLEK